MICSAAVALAILRPSIPRGSAVRTRTSSSRSLTRSSITGSVFVQDTAPRPALWVGNNHGAAIIRVEPLD
jgi:hypothetical protein